jgi:hypothetical protein
MATPTYGAPDGAEPLRAAVNSPAIIRQENVDIALDGFTHGLGKKANRILSALRLMAVVQRHQRSR